MRDNKTIPIRQLAQSSSIEVEQCVLGGIMLDNSTWREVNRILTETDFFEAQHRLIFASIRALAERNLPIDIVTLATALEDAGHIEQVGGWAYLGRLSRDTPSAANIIFYATTVRIRSLERRRAAAISKEDHDQAAEITAAINSLRNVRQEASRFIEIASLCNKQPPAENWLIQHYLAADSLAVIFGDPSCGKSFIAIDMACCIATGRPWQGHATKTGNVLFIAGEGRNGLARRFKAWFEHHNEEPRNIVLSTDSIQLTDIDRMAAFLAELRAFLAESRALSPQLSMIIIDTINRNFGSGDENSTADMTRAVSSLDLLRTSTGATVVGLHHSGHGDKQRGRGSIVLKASVDCEYAAEKFDRTVQIRCTKAKDFDHPPPLAWTLEKQVLPWADEVGSSIDSAVLIPCESPGFPTKQKQETNRLGANQLKAIEILRELYCDRRSALEDVGLNPAHAKVRKSDWYKAMKDAGLIRQRITEVKAELLRRGLILDEGDFISITDVPV